MPQPESFKIFGASHIAAIALTLLLSFILIYLVRRYPSQKSKSVCSGILLISILLCTGFAYYYKTISGWISWQMDLPMHLCDWAMIAIIITLITNKQSPFELAYFWGLGGTLQAVITPDITEDFPSISFLLFFTAHCLVIVSILYFSIGLKLRPYPKSILKVFIWTQVYLVSAVIVNLLVKANYGYLMHKPANPTLIDFLGDWPYYLIWLELIALLSFFLYYSPHFLKDKLKKS